MAAYDDLIAKFNGTAINFTDLGSAPFSNQSDDSVPGTGSTSDPYRITYTFLQQNADVSAISYGTASDLLHQHYYGTTTPEYLDFAPLQAQIQAVETILKDPDLSSSNSFSVFFGDVANVTFGRPTTNNVAAIAIGANTSANSAIFGSTIGSQADAFTVPWNNNNQNAGQYGDIWFNSGASASDSSVDWNSTAAGTYTFQVILHELGHAVGLQHANATNAQSTINNFKYTVMADAFDSAGQPISTSINHPDVTGVFLSGLQLDDIAAIQSIYGRNYTKHSEDGTVFGTGNGFGPSGSPFLYTIWDGAGIHDKIDATGFDGGVQIDLRQGHFSSIGLSGTGAGATVPFDSFDTNGIETGDRGNVAISYFTVIEDATGGKGGDVLIGNAWANKLDGAEGNDILLGDGKVYDGDTSTPMDDSQRAWNSTDNQTYDANLSGNDTLIGGTGNDVLEAGAGSNQIAIGGTATFDANGNLTGTSHDPTDGNDYYIVGSNATNDAVSATVSISNGAVNISVSDRERAETNTALYSIENIVAQHFHNDANGVNSIDLRALNENPTKGPFYAAFFTL